MTIACLPQATAGGGPTPRERERNAHPAIDRAQAAAVLRTARQCLTRQLDASEACHWAMTLLPNSRAAQRAMIDWLMRCEAWNDAAAMISVGLLQAHAERDWKLWLRRARVMLALGRLTHAQDAVDRVFELRGDEPHYSALLVASDIACAGGDHTLAVVWLERADRLRPHRVEVLQRMIPALLAANRTEDAAEALSQASDAAPELVASVLLARHRPLDAREHLEAALRRADDPQRQRDLTLGVIDLLDRMGDWPALRTMAQEEIAMAKAGAPPPGGDTLILAHLARSAVSRGEFELAATMAERALNVPQVDAGTHEHAVRSLCAAAAAVGDTARARELLIQQNEHAPPTSPAREASVWLAALLGAVCATHADPRSARDAGADPATSVLPSLLANAVATFNAALAPNHARPDGATQASGSVMDHMQAAQWRQYRELCWGALGSDSIAQVARPEQEMAAGTTDLRIAA
jgi:tetratricopeptide (TPR) repeat protein